MKKQFSGQSVIEYFVMMALILAAILSTGFMERINSYFKTYFNSAAEKLR